MRSERRLRLGLALATLALAAAMPATGCAAERSAFSGERAFRDLKRIVEFGPRPSGSPALAELRRWIAAQIRPLGLEVEEDSFTASTPQGRVPMTNLIVKLPGARPDIVIIAGHYETKQFDDFRFVGANDAGSSTAFLIELARVLAKRKNELTYWLVFFDGEEAFRHYSPTDGFYGSRHLVARLAESRELGRVGAVMVVDMIADRDLKIHRDANSTEWLTGLAFGVARRLGYARHFSDELRAYEDDHVPFVRAGVPAMVLIDFDYGPGNRWWHTAEDTLDKCSPKSLEIVGRVVLGTLEELEKSNRLR
jgi:Zn-dependent M28 family amino/carboxypeptidase